MSFFPYFTCKWVSLGSKRDAGLPIFGKRDTGKSNYCVVKTGNEVYRDPENDKKMKIAYVHSVSGIRESDKTVSGIRDRNPPMRPPCKWT